MCKIALNIGSVQNYVNKNPINFYEYQCDFDVFRYPSPSLLFSSNNFNFRTQVFLTGENTHE